MSKPSLWRPLLGVLLALLGSSLWAQGSSGFPNRPVKWVVPFAPGGPTDTISRVIAARLSEQWGQPVVVENRSGASGNIGSEYGARSAPDGYTIVFGTQGTHASNIIFMPNSSFHPIRDSQAVTLLGTSCLALIVPTSLPVSSAKELVTWLGTQNGAANYSTAAAGSSQHVASELLLRRTGTAATHVPYRGSSAAYPDLISGRMSFMFENLPGAVPLAKSGRVRALAQTCERRASAAADLPTMVEAGFPGFVVEGWYGAFVAVKTPRAIVDQLSADINKALLHPDSLARWVDLGFTPIGSSPEVMAKRQDDDLRYWREMIEYTGVKMQ